VSDIAEWTNTSRQLLQLRTHLAIRKSPHSSHRQLQWTLHAGTYAGESDQPYPWFPVFQL